MKPSPSRSRAARCGPAAAIAALLAFQASGAAAHCFIGNRFLPATLVTDDPCVADELSAPTVSRFRTSDDPQQWETDISFELSKRITESFGISIGETWTNLRPPGGPNTSGWQNLETAFQYQVLKDPQHEFALLAGVVVEWGGTGAAGVGADPFTTVTPTLYFGKGFGDLPDTVSWIRPVALTGQVGYAIPTQSSSIDVDPDSGDITITPNPQFLVYSGSLQYSMPYLKSAVIDLGLPEFINHLIPIVEWQFQTPVANDFGTGIGTTGTINPGVIWVGDYFQVGIEAIIPVNSQSGSNIGVIGQLHLYLDDIFPNSIGKPLFGGGSGSSPRKIFGG